VGREWTVVAVRRADFDGAAAERTMRHVGAERSRLVRLELAGSDPQVQIEVKASLWAARPPMELREVDR
jgi:hypothetical protein